MTDRIRWNEQRNGFFGALHMFRISSGASSSMGRVVKTRYYLSPTFPTQWLKKDYRVETTLGADPETLMPVAEEILDELFERLGVAPKSEFIDYIGPNAQKAIVAAIKEAAEDAAHESYMETKMHAYPGELWSPDTEAWARSSWHDAVQGLVNAGILGPEAFE